MSSIVHAHGLRGSVRAMSLPRSLLAAALLVVPSLASAQTAPARTPRPRRAATATTSSAPPSASSAPASSSPAPSPAPAATENSIDVSAPVPTPPAPTASAAPQTPPQTTAPAPNPAFPTIALIDAFPAGVDPAAATFVTDTLRTHIAQLGYPIVPQAQLYDAARRVQLAFPPPPEGIGALMQAVQAPVAVTAEVRGGGGYYQALLRVRFAQEPVERIRQIVATQWTLGDSIRQALPLLLAPPATNPYDAYGAYGQPALPQDMTAWRPPPRRPPSRLHRAPFELALGFEFAFGPGNDAFWNFLGYGRAAWFPVDRFGITASVSYANLRGRTNRVSNALFMVGVETAVELITRNHVYLPLRAEVGYLPFNGPVVRATAGVAFNVATNTRIELDILSPTIWILPGVTAVSLDVGAQVLFDIGAPPVRRRRRRHRSSDAPSSSEPSAAPASAAPAGTAPVNALPVSADDDV